MSVPIATKAARHAISTFGRAPQVQPKKKTVKIRPPKVPQGHGREIWVYQHLQTRQVVYSLTKAMNNNAALTQIPFNGKKTVPPTLRKDHWAPLATISFPPRYAAAGLSVYQKLREFRVRHEHEWSPESMRREKDNVVIPRKKRGFVLMDQKANSVADMAEVLGRLWDREGAAEIGLRRVGEGVRVDVRWSNLLDAEFAVGWGGNVVHDRLEVTTNHRRVPEGAARALEEGEAEGEEVLEEGKEKEVVDGKVVL